jgi:chromosome segregation ATPase
MDVLPARIAALEGDLRRVTEARAAEADELARMLVRIAATERARATAEERAAALASRVQELETLRDEVRREREAMELATRRAELAERSAADGAEALERTRIELEADRLRSTELEAKLARMRREHGDELAALRTTRAEADQQAVRALEEERAAAAEARKRSIEAEAELAKVRQRCARAMDFIEEAERREEMAAALRARALERTRAVLTGNALDGESEVVVEAIEEKEIEEIDGELPE